MSNDQRKTKGQRKLRQITPIGENPHTALVDLLTDAMHAHGEQWVADALRIAAMHFNAEKQRGN